MSKNKILPYNPNLKKLARELRKNMTPGEVLLWQEIRRRKLGFQFHRQVPIDEFIVDFYCHELMLAIEVDGRYHDHPQVSVLDQKRQAILESMGVIFLRFEEAEIRTDLDAVVQRINDWIMLNTDDD